MQRAMGVSSFWARQEVWAVSLDVLDSEAREEGRGRFPSKTRFDLQVQCKYFHIPSFPPGQSCVVFHRFTSKFQPYSLFLFRVLIAGLANRAVRLPAGRPIAQWPEAVPRGPFGEASRVVGGSLPIAS
jgi:hypothetical protein